MKYIKSINEYNSVYTDMNPYEYDKLCKKGFDEYTQIEINEITNKAKEIFKKYDKLKIEIDDKYEGFDKIVDRCSILITFDEKRESMSKYDDDGFYSHNIIISKFIDEWYSVLMQVCEDYELQEVQYKCDQLEGVFKLLDDLKEDIFVGY